MTSDDGTSPTSPPGTPVILLTEPIAQAGLELLRQAGAVHIAGETDPDRLEPWLTEATALVVRSSPVTAAMLDRAPHLRVVGRHGAGLDNIDLAAARDRSVSVVHTPGANADSVAEFVVLAALALGRRLIPAQEAFTRGRLHGKGSLPSAVVQAGLTGTMLRGRVVGLIGLGAIGHRVAQLVTGLGATVVASDPHVSTPPRGVAMTDTASVLRSSDVVSLHIPLLPETMHLIDWAAIESMRPGALLVNTARGAVVDGDAVRAALDSGHLGGYAVDVYDPEPPKREDPLLAHPGVLATPHMAAMTVDALEEMSTSVANGVVTVLAGGHPPNLVDLGAASSSVGDVPARGLP
ncbi:MAG: NAD(P)-dependent oxidoreductase [Dehalococcoidia bacterium]